MSLLKNYFVELFLAAADDDDTTLQRALGSERPGGVLHDFAVDGDGTIADELITWGKQGDIAARREAAKVLFNVKDKKTGKNKEDSGLNACAAGLYTMSNVLSQNVWNEEQIKIRAGWLYNQAKEMWKI